MKQRECGDPQARAVLIGQRFVQARFQLYAVIRFKVFAFTSLQQFIAGTSLQNFTTVVNIPQIITMVSLEPSVAVTFLPQLVTVVGFRYSVVLVSVQKPSLSSFTRFSLSFRDFSSGQHEAVTNYGLELGVMVIFNRWVVVNNRLQDFRAVVNVQPFVGVSNLHKSFRSKTCSLQPLVALTCWKQFLPVIGLHKWVTIPGVQQVVSLSRVR